MANVVWCTGFRQDFSFIHPPWPARTAGRATRAAWCPTAPGLYFIGLLFQRGFYSMLIGGAGRDAAYVARHILRRSRARV